MELVQRAHPRCRRRHARWRYLATHRAGVEVLLPGMTSSAQTFSHRSKRTLAMVRLVEQHD